MNRPDKPSTETPQIPEDVQSIFWQDELKVDFPPFDPEFQRIARKHGQELSITETQALHRLLLQMSQAVLRHA